MPEVSKLKDRFVKCALVNLIFFPRPDQGTGFIKSHFTHDPGGGFDNAWSGPPSTFAQAHIQVDYRRQVQLIQHQPVSLLSRQVRGNDIFPGFWLYFTCCKSCRCCDKTIN